MIGSTMRCHHAATTNIKLFRFFSVIAIITSWPASVRSFSSSCIKPSSLQHRGFNNVQSSNNPSFVKHIPQQRHSIERRSFLHSTSSNNEDGANSKPFWRTAMTRNRDPTAAIDELLKVASKYKKSPSSSPSQSKNKGIDYLSSLSSSSPQENEEENRSLALLFVGPSHAPSFSSIVKKASEKLGEISSSSTTFVAVVGAGVIGGGEEVDPRPPPPDEEKEGEDKEEEEDDSYAMSLLYGILPSTAAATGFCVTNASGPPPSLSLGGNNMAKTPSYLIFADPWSPLDDVLSNLESDDQRPVIAGGISCPPLTPEGIVAENCESTVALDGLPLPRGSAVGICLTGSLGLQTIVAQGCRGVGPTYSVTSVASTEPASGNKGEDGMGKVSKGNVVMRLDDEPALHRLTEVTEQASDVDKALLRSGWLLCGISDESSDSSSTSGEDSEDAIQSPRDFLIRQVVGLVPEAKAIVIGSREIGLGDTFRFHVRDGSTAKDDLNLMVRRAKTERLFNSGSGTVGKPLAALQVSCVARGRSLYGRSNVDLEMVEELVEGTVTEEEEDDDDEEEDVPPPPVAGFFANGEIGPVGLTGFGSSPLSSSTSSGTHVHGFTTVTAVLCDFSEKKEDVEASSATESTILSTFDDFEEDAWG